MPKDTDLLPDFEDLGDLALAAPPVRPSGSLRERVLAATRSETSLEGYVDRLCSLLDLGAARVREILAEIGNVASDTWEASPTPGMRLLHFDGGPRVAEADCGLVHFVPGEDFPRHRHVGDEWSLILQGRVEEDDGSVSLPGDLMHRPAGSAHSFRAVGDEPLVFAVVIFEGIARPE